MSWYHYSVDSRKLVDDFRFHASSKSLKTLWAPDGANYKVFIKGEIGQVKEVICSFMPQKDEEPEELDLKRDFNDILLQVNSQRDAVDYHSAVRILVEEFRKHAAKKRIISIFTKDGQRKYVRKVGKLKGSNSSDLRLQVCGDYRGLIVWDEFPISEIEELKV